MTKRGRRLGPNHVGSRLEGTEDPDPKDLARGLDARGARHREGPEGDAADEDAPIHHSMTWSTRSRINGGMVRPSAFAAGRFMRVLPSALFSVE